MTIIIANDIPFTDRDLDPLKALGDSLAFAANDWGESRATAWIYGIVLGWDPDPEDLEDPEAGNAMESVAAKFGWTAEQVERLRELHRRFEALAS